LGYFGVRFSTCVAGHSSCPAVLVLSLLAGTQNTKSRKHRQGSSYKQKVRKGDAIAYDQFLSTRHYHERQKETDEKKNLLFCAFSRLPLHTKFSVSYYLSLPTVAWIILWSLLLYSAPHCLLSPTARSIPLST